MIKVRFVVHYECATYFCLEVKMDCLPPAETAAYLPGMGEQKKNSIFIAPFLCGKVTYAHSKQLFIIDGLDDECIDSEAKIKLLQKAGWYFSDHPFE